MAALNFQTMFDEYAASRAKTWDHDRSKSVGASEVFGCLRKGWFEKNPKNDYEPDEDFKQSYGATLRGDIYEEHLIVPAVYHGLKDEKLLLAGDDQQTIIVGGNSATPDGLVVGASRDALSLYGIKDIKSNCFVLEMKTIDPRAALNEEKAIHRGQVQQQMGLIWETTKWRPYFAAILYVNASFVDDVTIFVVPFDKKVWESAKKRADIMMNEDDVKRLRPEGKLTGGCEYCRWQKACSLVSTGSIPTPTKGPELEDADKEELVALLDDERKLHTEIKELELEHAEIKQDIKDIMIRLNRRWLDIEVDGRKFETRWTTQAGAKRFDKKAAEAAGLDLSPYHVQGESFEKFTIKEKQAK